MRDVDGETNISYIASKHMVTPEKKNASQANDSWKTDFATLPGVALTLHALIRTLVSFERAAE